MSKLVIIDPVITEKSLALVKKGYYTFRVANHAHKTQIASALEKLFGVDILSVQTIRMHGKTKRVGKLRKEVKRSDWKKAVARVKKGQKIDVFAITPEGSTNEKQKK